MNFKLSIFSIVLSIILGFLLAYLSIAMQKKSVYFLAHVKTKRWRTLIFLGIYLMRYSIYCLILIPAFLYVSLSPLFVIISFTLFFTIIIWYYNKEQKVVK